MSEQGARQLAIREVGDGTGGEAFERLVIMLGTARNFRVARGHHWPDMTPEERAAAVIAGLEQRSAPHDPDHGFPVSRRPKVDVSDYAAVVAAVNRMRDDGSIPEDFSHDQ